MTGAGAVAGLVTGAVVVAGWIALGWNAHYPCSLAFESWLPAMNQICEVAMVDDKRVMTGGYGIYEIIPGFVAAWLAI